MGQLRLASIHRDRSRGQSLVELALILPVVLLLTLIAIDFGRVYLGWVNLQNMARVAANYASNHPTAWATNDAAAKATYQDQIRADAKQNNCTLPLVSGVQTAPDPAFAPSTNIGSTAQVQLSCTFKILTPIISNIVGSGGNLTVSASSTFPIKSGLVATGGSTAVIPTAAFVGVPTTISNGSSVQFTDQSTDGPTSWQWSFGDGGSSTGKDPLHTYSLANPLVGQSFTVTLTATNSAGSSPPVTKFGYITVNPGPPTANFTSDKTSGDAPLIVQFTDTSSGTPNAWSWNFGDGTATSSAQNPTHTYVLPGTYTVSLTATSPAGSATVTKTNYIVVNVPVCVVPTFKNTNTSAAQTTWNAAGFSTTVLYADPREYKIKSQTLVGGSSVPCNSVITVSKN